MKQILIACLLGIGSLLPSKEVKSSVVYFCKKIDIHVTTCVLFATSQGADGAISRMEVYNTSMQLMLVETGCGGYSCAVDLSDLNPGQYIVKVYCANTTHTEGFTY